MALNEKGRDAESKKNNLFAHLYSLYALTKLSKENVEAYQEAILRSLENPVQLPVISIEAANRRQINHSQASSPIFLPDGRTLATDSGFWDAVTGKPINMDTDKHNINLNEKVASAISFWDTAVNLREQHRPLTDIDINNNVLWDMSIVKKLPLLYSNRKHMVSMALSPDGYTFAAGYYDGSVDAWNTVSGKQLLTAEELTSGNSATFSPNGRILATVSILWDMTTSNRLTELASAGFQATFSPDGFTLATSSLDTVYLWDATVGNRQLIKKDFGSARGQTLIFSSDGRILVACDIGGNCFWDTATGKSLILPLDDKLKYNLSSLAFSPDSRTIAAVSFDGTSVAFLDASTGREYWEPLKLMKKQKLVNLKVILVKKHGLFP